MGRGVFVFFKGLCTTIQNLKHEPLSTDGNFPNFKVKELNNMRSQLQHMRYLH